MVVRLLVVALGLLTFTACSGQSGTEKDGGPAPAPCEPAAPVPDDMAGQFLAPGLVVEVELGEPELVCTEDTGLYDVPVSVWLLDSELGVDEHLAAVMPIEDAAELAFTVEVPVAVSGNTWSRPAMEQATEVVYTYDVTWQGGEPDHPWTFRVGWRGLSGDTVVEGQIRTWTPSRF